MEYPCRGSCRKKGKKGWVESKSTGGKGTRPIKIQEIDTDKKPRISTNDSELNRVMGGGLFQVQ